METELMRMVSKVGYAIAIGSIAWIGVQVSAIPVMQETLKHIQEDIGTRAQNNSNRIDDHEVRIRALEKESLKSGK